jgi:hypothetical protein
MMHKVVDVESTTVIVENVCPFCGDIGQVKVSKSGYEAWQQGAFIQEAFPNLSPNCRELLMTGICPTCWDKSFDA